MKNKLHYLFLFSVIGPYLTFNYAFAESDWIKDPVTGCIFFNANPQPNEAVTFEGTCNKKNAKGKLTWFKDGQINEVAEGQWVNGRQTGQGTYQFMKSGAYYEGYFVEGRRTGKGTFKWPNGNLYEGQFFEGKFSGNGRFKWANGDNYEGQFVEGKRTGKGTYKWVNGNSYEGFVVDGKLEGKGSFKWASGAVYVGDFVGGKPHGKGRINRLQDQPIYEGEFANGLESGNGTWIFPDGKKFEGQFSNGVPYGEGVVYFPDGKSSFVRYEGDKLIQNELNQEHLTCVKLGFASGSAEYASCRTQIEIAKNKAIDQELLYQQQMVEAQKRMEEDRREANIMRGLGALAAGASILQPPPLPITPDQRIILPNGKAMTCSTFGNQTKCF